MIVVLFLFGLFLLSYRINRSWAHPAVLMCGLWTFILFFYECNILPLNKIHWYTYTAIALGVLFFVLGVGVAKKTKIVFSTQNKGTVVNEYTPKYKGILWLAIFTLIMQLPDVFNSISILLEGGSFSTLRSQASETVIKNPLLNAIRNYILNPFTIFLYPISAYGFLTLKNENKNRSCKKWIFFLAIIISIFEMFTSGGRASAVYLLVHVIVIMQLMKRKMRIHKTLKILIGFILVAVAVVIYYISRSRGIDDLSKSLVLYFNGCVPLLDYYLTEIIVMDATTYGGAFLFAPIQLFFTLVDNIGISQPGFVTSLTAMLNVETNVTVGPDILMNAFVSWFFYLFYDGGFVALAIGAFIYGAFSCTFYKKANTGRKSVRGLIGYSIIAQTIIFSMVRYQFINYYYWLAFIFLWLLIKKEPVKTKMLGE